jgi:metal-responsive CopG/Arc/MetJ family transcriptional regulator
MAEDDVRITLVLPQELLAEFDAVAKASFRSRAAEMKRLMAARVAEHKAQQAGGESNA